MASSIPVNLPTSYRALSFTQIRLSHVPASSPSPHPVILVTLYRPNKYNAFTDTMMEELDSPSPCSTPMTESKPLLSLGMGKCFAPVWIWISDLKVNEHRDGGGRLVLAIHRCGKPTITALNGCAVGIGFVFARRGIVMEACFSFFLPRLIGYSKALHLVTTGATYPASSPLLSDLFSEVLPNAEAVLPRAVQIAKDVADSTSVVSTALMRDMIWRNPGSGEGTHLLDSKTIYELFSGSDNAEGVQYFKEKRTAMFSGTMAKDAPAAYPWWEPIDVHSGAKPLSSSGMKLKL